MQRVLYSQDLASAEGVKIEARTAGPYTHPFVHDSAGGVYNIKLL